MSTLKSSSDHLTINADGAAKDLKFQLNGVQKADLSSAGLTVVGDIVPSSPMSHRNMIINGEMQVWQRATAATATTSGYTTVDRWNFVETSAGSYTSEQHTMALAELNTTGHRLAMKVIVTGADTSIASGDIAYFQTKLEGQDVQNLQYGTANAKTVTLSFWVKSSLAGVYTTCLVSNSATTYYCPVEYTISDADTWEQKTITITPTAGSTTLITNSGGLTPNTAAVGMTLIFNLMSGTGNNGGTTNTWATANQATSNQTNLLASTHNFYLTGVQLELGSSATPFEHRTYGDVLDQCDRYYQKYSYDLTSAEYTGLVGFNTSTTQCFTPFMFRKEMRAAPTGTVTVGGTWEHEDTGGNTTCVTTPTIDLSGRYSCRFIAAGMSGLNDGDGCSIRRNGALTSYFDLDAEL